MGSTCPCTCWRSPRRRTAASASTSPGVHEILGRAGLDADALQTPADFPLDPHERDAWIADGRRMDPVAMNCSGKHAAMLATCVVNDWPIETYRAADHPLQQSIRWQIEALAGERVEHVGVDGCGAPVLSLTLAGLARSMSRAVQDEPESPARRITEAMVAFPEFVGGTNRDVTAFMRAVPGLVAKDGAEGVYVAALPDGTARGHQVRGRHGSRAAGGAGGDPRRPRRRPGRAREPAHHPGARRRRRRGTGVVAAGLRASAVPSRTVTHRPPTQMTSPTRVTLTRPARPSRVPCAATYVSGACPEPMSHWPMAALREPVTGSSAIPCPVGKKARTSTSASAPAPWRSHDSHERAGQGGAVRPESRARRRRTAAGVPATGDRCRTTGGRR